MNSPADQPAPARPDAPAPASPAWKPAVVSVIAFIAALAIVSQAYAPQPLRFAVLAAVLIQEGALVAAWLIAAAGWGWPVRHGLIEGRLGRIDGAVLQLALGIGVMLMLDWLLLWAGWMNGLTAWGMAIVGVGLLLGQMGFEAQPIRVRPLIAQARWLCVPAAVGAGVMFGAATMAPGVLWPSEFGGYDVLSYHLQLPREWLAGGAMAPLEHNVYSYMPNMVECAFAHLGVWRGGVIEAGHATQLLGAAFAVMTAFLIARLVTAVAPERDGLSSAFPGVLAGAVYLVTPWTVVTGSMAYTEQAMLATGAAAGLLAVKVMRGEGGLAAVRPAIAVGLLLGVSAMCKLTGAVMIGLPLLVVMARPMRDKGASLLVPIAAGAALLVAAPWLVRNALWTGNPLFPMFTETLGLGHWTAEQAARWGAAHAPPVLGEWPTRLWEQWLTHWQFGVLLWPAAGFSAWLCRKDERLKPIGEALLLFAGLQLVAWLLLTHQQSRFLVPMLLPGCVLIGVAASQSPARWPGLAGGVLTGWLAFVGLGLYMNPAQAGAVYLIGGVDTARRQIQPYATLNDPEVIGEGARLYAEGFATPLYVERPMDYHTVWDASALGRAIDQRRSAAGAIDWLREAGYTHLLIDYGMIERWMSAENYGYDPAVTVERLQAIAALGLPFVECGQGSGVMVYRLNEVDD